MQFIFKKKAIENEAATRASFHVAHLLAKKGKPFTDGELIKQCLNEVAKEMCPEKVDFENPFDSIIGDLPSELQMEVIDLQSNDILKDKYKEGNLTEFYKCLPSDQFVYLRKFACEFISVFGTTYLCEKTFSKMKYTKSCYRSQLSD